ncbi:MAG: nucleotidyltransferase family protein [Spirochaetota bacterium]
MQHSVETIVLAAGYSSRFAGNKLLQPYRHRRVVQAVVEIARAVSSRVIVVLGHDAERVSTLLAGMRGVDRVFNDWYPLGMFTSIQRGVREVTAARFAVLPGDLPGVDTADVESVLEGGFADVARPVCHGRPGHPVVMSRKLIPRILSSPPTATMQEIHRHYSVHLVEVDNPLVCADIDTQAEYQRLDNRT